MKTWSIDQGCSACGKNTENGSVLHHLYTRKAYPEHQIKPWNLFPCCVICHALFHQHGTSHMAKKYSSVNEWLISNGWKYDKVYRKWRHDKSG